MLTASISVSAQEIVVDKVADNYRCVEASRITARSFTDRVVWNFGLKGITNKEETCPDSASYVLIINLNAAAPINYPETTTLLIKTGKDDVIELKSITAYHGNSVLLGYSYNRPIVGNVGTVSQNVITRNIAEFVIEASDIEKLQDGVAKVRVQTTNGYLEKEYKKDKAGVKLYQSYLNIKKRLSEPQKSIREGF